MGLPADPQDAYQNLNGLVGFDWIVNIEWLGPDDDTTGRKLACHLVKQASRLGIIVDCHTISTRHELETVLDNIRKNLQVSTVDKIKVPLLHLETHGSSIELGPDQVNYISYEDLFVPLRAINELTNNNLIVVVAACIGAHLIDVVQNSFSPPTAAPFFGICGPTISVYEDDVLNGFKAFYDELLQSNDIRKSLDALRREFLVPSEITSICCRASFCSGKDIKSTTLHFARQIELKNGWRK